MQRISLGKPYDTYIKQMIDAGYFSSATELIRDALRMKMEDNTEANQKVKLQVLIQKGIDDFEAGRHVEYTPELLENLHGKAIENVKQNKPIKNEIRPQ